MSICGDGGLDDVKIEDVDPSFGLSIIAEEKEDMTATVTEDNSLHVSMK